MSAALQRAVGAVVRRLCVGRQLRGLRARQLLGGQRQAAGDERGRAVPKNGSGGKTGWGQTTANRWKGWSAYMSISPISGFWGSTKIRQ